MQGIQNEVQVWQQILHRVIDVVLLCGTSNRIGDINNGNFWAFSHYNPISESHLQKVKRSQMFKSQLQVHYWSPATQNELIACGANKSVSQLLLQRQHAKYYSEIVEAIPDSPYQENTVFLLVYLPLLEQKNYKLLKLKERFPILKFVNCNKKTGQDIANLICTALNEGGIPIADC